MTQLLVDLFKYRSREQREALEDWLTECLAAILRAMTDAELFGFAGLWRPTPDGPRYAFLTCEPNELVGRIHPKAMPVILDSPSDAARWLSVDGAAAAAMQCPLADEAMAEIEVADSPPAQGALL